MVCSFGWLGPAWEGWLGHRHVVVAVPEERTRYYGVHNRRHECCITLSKRVLESPKPFLLQSQHPSFLFPRATAAAAGVWAGTGPGSEWQAALYWWKGYSKAFEMPLLGALTLSPDGTYTFFQGILRRVVCVCGKVFPGLCTPCASNQTIKLWPVLLPVHRLPSLWIWRSYLLVHIWA